MGDPGNRKYHDDKIFYIRIMYVIAVVIWCLIIWFLKLYKTDTVGILILLLPLIVFGVTFYFIPDLCANVEYHLMRTNMLSVGLLLIMGLLAALEQTYGGTDKLGGIMILAIILTLLSLIDFWLPINYLSLQKHYKSICQTLSICLLIFILYSFYKIHKVGKIDNEKKLFSDVEKIEKKEKKEKNKEKNISENESVKDILKYY